MSIIELACGAARVRVAPDMGAAITAFTLRDVPVLRPTPEQVISEGNVRLASCFPLVPWSNRIRDSRLAFRGRKYALERNFGTHPHAIHGVGWQRAWSVAEALPRFARLVLAHDALGSGAAAWPWPFRATQTLELVGAGETGGADESRAACLHATLTLENVGSEAFPFGLGWHPYLPGDAATTLCFSAEAVWVNDATQLPDRRIAVPAHWRFEPPRAFAGSALDNVFTGWSGTASLANRTSGLRTTLTADRACHYLVVYAPPGADFGALEPVTHETDAFNRSANGIMNTGFRTLAPGAAFSCTMRIAAAPLD